MANEVLYQQEGHLVTIWLNRPQVHNAINGETAAQLRAAWERFRDDDSAWVAILASHGPSFSAGADLKSVDSLRRPENPFDPDFIYRGTGYLGFTRMTDIFKPTIAAIQGHCVAGGLEMALWCDIRIAAPNARFGCLERRWNVPLIDGGTQRLPRVIGWGRAMDLIITGREIDAQTALNWGLVSEVAETATVYDRARVWAQDIMKNPQSALRTDKQAAVRGWGLNIEEALRVEAQLGMTQLFGHDMQEGLEKFQQRSRTKTDDKEGSE